MKNAILLTLAAVSVLPLAACSNYRESGGDERPASYLSADAQRTIDSFRAGDPTLAKFFDKAHAIVVFPTISKGGLIAGAANGEGVVYQGGQIVGYATMTQITVGAQIGGQAYSELMFIQDAPTFNRFKLSQTEFAANASAVIAKSGAGATNDYDHGLAVFVKPKEGVMAEAAIGGQKYRFRAAN